MTRSNLQSQNPIPDYSIPNAPFHYAEAGSKEHLKSNLHAAALSFEYDL